MPNTLPGAAGRGSLTYQFIWNLELPLIGAHVVADWTVGLDQHSSPRSAELLGAEVPLRSGEERGSLRVNPFRIVLQSIGRDLHVSSSEVGIRAAVRGASLARTLGTPSAHSPLPHLGSALIGPNVSLSHPNTSDLSRHPLVVGLGL